MGNNKNWRPTEQPKVNIHFDEIPAIEMKLLCAAIIHDVEEYFKDPAHVAEFEEWRRTYKYREKG